MNLYTVEARNAETQRSCMRFFTATLWLSFAAIGVAGWLIRWWN